MPPRPASLLAAVLALSFAAPAAAAQPSPDVSTDPELSGPYNGTETSGMIAPGARAEHANDEDLYCTLNFVVTNGTDYWIGTAGHCFEEGAPIAVRGEVIGHLDERSPDPNYMSGPDWGFVHIEEEHEDEVNPTVLVYGGPTKVPSTDRGPGDPVFYYGHGRDDSSLQQGVTLLPNPLLRFVGRSSPGASGAPLLDASGQALGIVTGEGIHLTSESDEGHQEIVYASPFQGALSSFESAAGLDLRLVPGEPFLAQDELDPYLPNPSEIGEGDPLSAVPG